MKRVLKYLNLFINEFCIAFSLTVFFVGYYNDTIDSRYIFYIAIWMAAIIVYQLALQFVVENNRYNYWKLNFIISGYIGGFIIFQTLGIILNIIGFSLINIIVYIAIHTLIILIEYQKEEREVKEINKKLQNKSNK